MVSAIQTARRKFENLFSSCSPLVQARAFSTRTKDSGAATSFRARAKQFILAAIPVTARITKKQQSFFPEIDYFLIGIGAYRPVWFMEPNHNSPEDSVQAFC
jgi:hypothetical protein